MDARLTIMDAIKEVEESTGIKSETWERLDARRFPNGDVRLDNGRGVYNVGWILLCTPIEGTPLQSREELPPRNGDGHTGRAPDGGNGNGHVAGEPARTIIPKLPRVDQCGRFVLDRRKLLAAVERLAEARHLTQNKVGPYIGGCPATVSNWKYRNVDEETIRILPKQATKYADRLGVSLDSLAA